MDLFLWRSLNGFCRLHQRVRILFLPSACDLAVRISPIGEFLLLPEKKSNQNKYQANRLCSWRSQNNKKYLSVITGQN